MEAAANAGNICMVYEAAEGMEHAGADSSEAEIFLIKQSV